MDAVNAHLDAFLRAESAYCHRCGALLERIEIRPSKSGEQQYRVSCPGCGWENKAWSPSASSSRGDIRMVPLSSDAIPAGISKGRWARMIRDRRLSQLSI